MNTRNRIFGIAYWICQALWISLCVAVLVIYIHTRANGTDADIFPGYAMIVLSFPVSFVDLYLHGWIEYLTNLRGGTIWMWVELFILGYIQWFVLLPLVIRAVRRRVGARAKGQGVASG
jgi:hypothetical protein